MPGRTGCVVFGLLAAAIARAGGSCPPDFPGIQPGADPQRVERALRSAGADSFTRRERQQPQALCRGLVDSRLLETMNHFGVAPLDGQSRLDPGAFHTILTARRGDRSHTMAFSDPNGDSSRPRLGAVLVRIRVPVDQAQDPARGWSRQRLHRLHEALAELAPCHLKPADTDRYGNTFTWKGNHPSGWTVFAWYLPEQDELRLLATTSTQNRQEK